MKPRACNTVKKHMQKVELQYCSFAVGSTACNILGFIYENEILLAAGNLISFFTHAQKAQM